MSANDCFNETVKKGFNDTKVSYWFKKLFPDVSYTLVFKLIRKGIIRINGSRVKHDYILKENDQIKIPKILKNKKIIEQKVNLSDTQKKRALSLVIYKNNEFIILDKPSGLSVQGGTNVRLNIDVLLDALKFDYDERPKLVHRIDKDTSGILLIARTLEVAKFATELFRNRKISKIYIAIVYGKLKSNSGTLNFFLEEKNKLFDSKTYYKVLHYNLGFSVIALKPITGRKHQLR
ncbi:RluA family pseudouridine synthase, partial [Rickettsiales bacterium]|nr:RluA family pseudouridine synthase [Rickettsiales bacterium]